MRGVSGIYMQKHLYGHHLADIERVAEAAVKLHETQGCGFADDWKELLRAHLLAVIPDIVGDFLERKDVEVHCPKRDAEVKEAA